MSGRNHFGAGNIAAICFGISGRAFRLVSTVGGLCHSFNSTVKRCNDVSVDRSMAIAGIRWIIVAKV